MRRRSFGAGACGTAKCITAPPHPPAPSTPPKSIWSAATWTACAPASITTTPGDAALARLRNGDLRRWLAAAAGDHRAYPAALVFTTVFWRSAWKYRERGYRYCYWDLGTMAANLLATGNSENVPVELRFGFADRPLTGFFGIDGVTEAPSLVAFLGAPDGELPPRFRGCAGNAAPGKQRPRRRRH